MTAEFVDNAYKTGAGRYLQEGGALSLLGNEVLTLGSKAFVAGGPISFPQVRDAVVSSLATASAPYELAICEGHPTCDDAHLLAERVHESGCDVVVGVGGGRMMDIAKAVASCADVPVITVPTSMATCAAFSPLSVMYAPSGAIETTWRFTREVDAVIVDMDVMAKQPARLIAAGVLDGMAKKPEIDNGGTGEGGDFGSVQRFSAYHYACVNYDLLERNGAQAYRDVAAGALTDALERTVFTAIALTGVVSALTRGFHQTAHAHQLCYGVNALFGPEAHRWLHGELVGIGLSMQFAYNGAPDQAVALRSLMRAMDMPCTLAELGISRADQRLDLLRDYVMQSDFVSAEDAGRKRIARAFEEIVK